MRRLAYLAAGLAFFAAAYSILRRKPTPPCDCLCAAGLEH